MSLWSTVVVSIQVSAEDGRRLDLAWLVINKAARRVMLVV